MNEKTITIKLVQDVNDPESMEVNCDIENVENMQELLLATSVLIQTSLDMADEPIDMEDYLEAIRETIDENPLEFEE